MRYDIRQTIDLQIALREVETGDRLVFYPPYTEEPIRVTIAGIQSQKEFDMASGRIRPSSPELDGGR